MSFNFYLSNVDITALQYEHLAESAPSPLEEAQGWTCGKVTALASPYKPDTVQAVATFVTEPSPFGALGYRSLGLLNGEFVVGNWVLSFKVKSNAYYAQKGYVKFRLWRSTNANGSGATQITPSWRSSVQVGFTAANQYQTGTVTWASGSVVTLADEYLFLEIEWYATVSGGNASAAVSWVHNEGLAEGLAAPNFTRIYAGSIAVIAAPQSAYTQHFNYFNSLLAIALVPSSWYTYAFDYIYAGQFLIVLAPNSAAKLEWFYAGPDPSGVLFWVDEGETRILEVLFGTRPPDTVFYLGLYTNSSDPTDITALAGLLEPVGASYQRKSISAYEWSVHGNIAECSPQYFQPSELWGNVYGYFIATSPNGSGKLLGVEKFTGAPYKLHGGCELKILPRAFCS